MFQSLKNTSDPYLGFPGSGRGCHNFPDPPKLELPTYPEPHADVCRFTMLREY